jgi:hypothetical protein
MHQQLIETLDGPVRESFSRNRWNVRWALVDSASHQFVHSGGGACHAGMFNRLIERQEHPCIAVNAIDKTAMALPGMETYFRWLVNSRLWGDAFPVKDLDFIKEYGVLVDLDKPCFQVSGALQLSRFTTNEFQAEGAKVGRLIESEFNIDPCFYVLMCTKGFFTLDVQNRLRMSSRLAGYIESNQWTRRIDHLPFHCDSPRELLGLAADKGMIQENGNTFMQVCSMTGTIDAMKFPQTAHALHFRDMVSDTPTIVGVRRGADTPEVTYRSLWEDMNKEFSIFCNGDTLDGVGVSLLNIENIVEAYGE